jgi:hypothetical protein
MVLVALDGFLHLSANIFSHIGAVINNPGDSRSGNPGLSGYVFKGKRGHLNVSWFGSAPKVLQPDIELNPISIYAILYIVRYWERSQRISIIQLVFAKVNSQFFAVACPSPL